MKRPLFHCAWLIFGLLAVLPARADLPLPVEQALRAEAIPSEAVSVYVRQLGANEAAVTHFATRALNPASTMKLVTTYAGLELLGPAYRWRTEIYREGEMVAGVLEGNLSIKGYGNPELMQQDLWRMLNELRQTGLRDIRGDLIIDDSYFAPGSADPGLFDNEPYRAYNSIPNALAVNLNSTSFRFLSDGEQLAIQPDPDLPEIQLSNQVRLMQAPCTNWRDKLVYKVQNEGSKATVTFTGDYPASCEEKYLELSLFSPPSYTYHLFRRIWQQLGGTISGDFKVSAVSESAVRMTEYSSQPLADVIRRVNKYSNNLMTRQLLLTIAAERIGIPGNEESGRLAILNWLAGKDMHFPELVIENGSGLSRIERISAEHLGQLLADAYASPVMPELMSSLPVLAVDGTVVRRLNGSGIRGRAHLKTGSLNSVRSIAGYILDQKGRRWVVVFMVNHPRAGATKPAQDALLDWVYQQP
ncbi:serine-type D-Ala-D-Ala carboxypeptidase/endopeptidase (penicillin-binding protein 4) [Methylophilaceae bacterium]|nr:serine-type D-Ala-D-Ala carboxypeptidase/endopeptidase (penicillin-binding protein 4) [Methylophilaceae bacterium]